MGKTTTIKREVEIDLAKDKVWKMLADFGNISYGHPAVSKSYVTSEQKEGIGATRHCDFTVMGASAEERIIGWIEGKNVKTEVYQSSKMTGIDKMELSLIIRERGNRTVLTGNMQYSMKNGFFDLMNRMMMKRSNAKLLGNIIAGHKLFIETGTVVDENTRLDLSYVITPN